MAKTRAQYVEQLAHFLGPTRIKHSINVADAAVELAQLFAPQLARQAEVAGLLHDHGKRFTNSELMQLALKYDISMTAGESAQPALLHGKVGAALLAQRFGVIDAAVSQAISDHVTGRPGMGQLSRILYVADQMAADREFEGVAELRQLARRDLDAAVLLVVKHKLNYVMLKNRPIEEQGVALYNEMLAKLHGVAGV
jgi:predicted HD superfamily hydrolase involved in NAD metabolism